MAASLEDFDFSAFSLQERLLLAQELLYSALDDMQAEPIAPEQMQEMERRLADLRSGQVVGESWESIERRVQQLR
ncbi:MAG: addiction module protein [Phycisphaerales bacterium]|nr:addiction module protein [Phycisphaerales bacterium]